MREYILCGMMVGAFVGLLLTLLILPPTHGTLYSLGVCIGIMVTCFIALLLPPTPKR